MAFDPKQFGAKPVATSTFDASKFGAKPVVATTSRPQVSPTASIDGFLEIQTKLEQRSKNVADAVTRPFLEGQPVENGAGAAGAFGARTTMGTRGVDDTVKKVGQAGARVFGEVGGAITDVLGSVGSNIFNKLAPPALKEYVATVAGRFQDQTQKSEAVQGAIEKWNEFSNSHPDIAQFVGDVAKGYAAKLAVEGGGSGLVKTGEKAAEATAKAKKAINPIIEARKAATADNAAKEVDNLAGTIVQGKTEDITKAKAALRTIDVDGIKTYDDLSQTLDQKISAISDKLDETLGTSKETKPLADLTVSAKVGDSVVTHNYVEDALQQLEDHFKATNDVKGAERLNQIKAKASGEGLSAQDVNRLAKMHGAEIEAFNANGQAASGLSKQAAENTRKGLKATSREMFNNPAFKSADLELTNLIRTKDLVDRMTEEVNKLQQKIKERTWGEKLGRKFAEVVNLVGLNSPKGFVEYFLSRGTGLKTLNALDLEKALEKNLKQLQKALKEGASEQDIEAALQAIIDDAMPAKPTPGKSGK